MTEAWPGTLPQTPLLEGYTESLPNQVIRSQMETGPAKVRRRFTAAIKPFTVNLLMTLAQTVTLETFYETTLNGGVDQFTWLHPRTTDAITFRFVSPPVFVTRGVLFGVVLQLESLP